MISQKEKRLLAEVWKSLIPAAEDIGSDSLLRMFTAFPGSKTYFSHLDISPRSPHMLSHGRKIVLAIAEGAQDISQLAVNLAPLQILHAYQLRIDPTNFKLLTHCLLVALACHLGDDFTPEAHAAIDKYLSAFAAVLAEKYR
ncbi:hemoglobin subunit alpha-D-like [Takifugu rubripes]|uniref:Hemoglobin alpha 4 subunit n=1 Tax=Takifugu rubripes TaxID=31033 RepID=Q802A2_TAKRU|nr:hemoglobin subunit alpha-D [Takifugu rubripes]AAO61494.1 hemoglobin alpha 4 subunit [Takifugu rubripes]|eukprot:XP_011602994.1 PREDICTED: hemoglobin subunit alpha-D-like [Takifugu rubripes]